MLSGAANGYYRRNVRAGVPGAAAGLGARQGMASMVAPNVNRLNGMRQINTQAAQGRSQVSPLAQIGQALAAQGAGPQIPAMPMQGPAPAAIDAGPSGGFARLATQRPKPRQTPFVF